MTCANTVKITIEVEVSDVGPGIARARKALGLSQTKVAAEADMSQANLYRIENEDPKSIPLDTLLRTAKAVGIEEELSQRIFKAVAQLFNVSDS